MSRDLKIDENENSTPNVKGNNKVLQFELLNIDAQQHPHWYGTESLPQETQPIGETYNAEVGDSRNESLEEISFYPNIMRSTRTKTGV